MLLLLVRRSWQIMWSLRIVGIHCEADFSIVSWGEVRGAVRNRRFCISEIGRVTSRSWLESLSIWFAYSNYRCRLHSSLWTCSTAPLGMPKDGDRLSWSSALLKYEMRSGGSSMNDSLENHTRESYFELTVTLQMARSKLLIVPDHIATTSHSLRTP